VSPRASTEGGQAGHQPIVEVVDRGALAALSRSG